MLRDIGISGQLATVLADVLPRLQLLKGLDLSSNHLTLPVLHVLMPAVRQCKALRSLDLWKTLTRKFRPIHAGGLGEVASAVQVLEGLTSLSVGVYDRMIIPRENATFNARFTASAADSSANISSVQKDCRVFCGVFAALPDLRRLHLDLPGPEVFTTEVLKGIAASTQLHSLHFSLPDPVLQGSNLSATPMASRKLTQLTYLHFDMYDLQPPRPASGNAQTQIHLIPLEGRNALGVFSNLLSLSSLKHLAVVLHVSRSQQYFRAAGALLASALSSLQHLTNLELFTPSINLAPHLIDSVRILLPVVKAAADLPALSALHLPVNIAPCSELPQLTALLLQLTGHQQQGPSTSSSIEQADAPKAVAVDVSIDLSVNTNASEADLTFASYQACKPLLSCCKKIHFTGCAVSRPRSDQDIRPTGELEAVLVDPLSSLQGSISMHGLSQLRELCIIYHPHASRQMAPGSWYYTQILNSISCLLHLTKLGCFGGFRWSRNPEDSCRDVEGLSGFIAGLRQLHDLSEICIRLGSMSEDFQVDFLRSCGSSYMPNLRVLNLLFCLGLCSACDEVLQLLAVKELSVFLIDCSNFFEFEAWAKASFCRLRHLRVLRLHCCAMDLNGLWEAAADLPAFQAICCP